MAIKKITSYEVMWQQGADKGAVRLNLEGGAKATFSFDNPMEQMLITDILRNERPVEFNTSKKILFTGKEPVGEWAESSD